MKLILYQKGSNKPIVLSDPGSSFSLKNEDLSSIFESDKINRFETKTDVVLFRGSELAGIMISDGNKEVQEEDDEQQTLPQQVPVIKPKDKIPTVLKNLPQVKPKQSQLPPEKTIPNKYDGELVIEMDK